MSVRAHTIPVDAPDNFFLRDHHPDVLWRSQPSTLSCSLGRSCGQGGPGWNDAEGSTAQEGEASHSRVG
jgi:hypothetical protein